MSAPSPPSASSSSSAGPQPRAAAKCSLPDLNRSAQPQPQSQTHNHKQPQSQTHNHKHNTTNSPVAPPGSLWKSIPLDTFSKPSGRTTQKAPPGLPSLRTLTRAPMCCWIELLRLRFFPNLRALRLKRLLTSSRGSNPVVSFSRFLFFFSSSSSIPPRPPPVSLGPAAPRAFQERLRVY